MIISIASGKGGTGKTTVATNLAVTVANSVQLLDCDVEEPNAPLFIRPKFDHKEPVTVSVPEIDEKNVPFVESAVSFVSSKPLPLSRTPPF